MRHIQLALAISLALITVSCGVGVSPVVRQPKPLDATTQVTANQGSLVFSDDFNDSQSGWSTDHIADFSASFTKDGYKIVTRRFVDHQVQAPYTQPKDQLSISLTAIESLDSPVGSGFGTGCSRGSSESTVNYDFTVDMGGTWSLYKHDTRPGATTTTVLLKKGTSPATIGGKSVTVELMCATLADGATTRLVTFVDGSQVADLTDVVPDLPRIGWLGWVDVLGEDSGWTTVTASHFEERDLEF